MPHAGLMDDDPKKRGKLDRGEGEDLNNDAIVYKLLVRSQVLDGKLDFNEFDRLTEKALYEEMPDFDYHELLAEIESAMTQLGVMPFDEAALPPEDPRTF
jgi:hypothetical protein